MDIYVRCTTSGLVPLYDSDFENKKKLKIGEDYRVTITKPRNYQFHKLFFALIGMAFHNQDHYQFQEQLLIDLKLRVGHYDLQVSPEGKDIYVPKSISFAAMDQDAFKEFYDKCLSVIRKRYLGDMSEEDINKNLSSFM